MEREAEPSGEKPFCFVFSLRQVVWSFCQVVKRKKKSRFEEIESCRRNNQAENVAINISLSLRLLKIKGEGKITWCACGVNARVRVGKISCTKRGGGLQVEEIFI